MIQMKSTNLRGSNDFLNCASEIASYYGFKSLRQRNSRKVAVGAPPSSLIETYRGGDFFNSEITTVAQQCMQDQSLEKMVPALFYSIADRAVDGRKTSTRDMRTRFSLTIFGIEKSIAEALILRSTLAILEECGIKGVQISINSIGDRDSSQKFSRELSSYLRRHMSTLSNHQRTLLRRDIFLALEEILDRRHPVTSNLPKPMTFLSSKSRKHLREVLEYLESTNIPFQIDNALLGHRNFYSQTLFEIRPFNPESQDISEKHVPIIYARGGRFDELSRRLFKQLIPSVGIVIEIERSNTRAVRLKTKLRIKAPRFFFVQLGDEARRQSLRVMDMLRRSNIPTHTAYGKETLNDQLEHADSLNVPYILIMGQREVLDGSVIVRDMVTRAQEAVPIDSLASHLKSIR
jgi:histidyl-tRNA synthetase